MSGSRLLRRYAADFAVERPALVAAARRLGRADRASEQQLGVLCPCALCRAGVAAKVISRVSTRVLSDLFRAVGE